MNKRNRKLLNYAIAFVVSFCCICLVIGFAVASGGDVLSTPTPALLPLSDPSIIIAQTSSAAQTQTLIAAPLTSTPFIFDTPTMQPVTLAPTWTEIPTNTPFALGTQKIGVIPIDETCPCAGDTLNCSDFSTHTEAQACFDYCMSQGAGDIHKLDENNDLNPCESLR